MAHDDTHSHDSPSADRGFRHDLLNHVGAAKMSAQLIARSKALPESLKANVERILTNLMQIQELVSSHPSDQSFETTASPIAESVHSRVKSVLLIDDSLDLQALLLAILPPRGYDVSVASNADEAVQALSQGGPSPDLILLDYSLGDSTGHDVLDALEAAGAKALAETKIILFTAHGDSVHDSRVHAVEPKSMDMEALVSLVKKYCDGRA